MSKASHVEDAIVAWFFYHGGWCANIYVGGIPIGKPIIIRGRKYFQLRPNPKRVGTSDLLGCLKGLSYRIEVKVGKDKESVHQRVDRKNYEESGGISMIVKSFDDFLNQIKVLQNIS